MIKRFSSLLVALFVTVSTVVVSFYFTNTASAVTGSDWRAGRIIDDTIFTNKDAMSVGEIQSFLNGMVGTGGYDSVPGQCDTSGARNAQPFSSLSRAEYARSLGRSDKFTCLNIYYEVPKTTPGPDVPASNYGGAPIPAGAESAAQLIWDAAQRHNISPKVLLVTIQKESAGPLTIDDWPFQKQYKYAMGAHCPDNPPADWPDGCDPNYSGFSLQIDESASLFRWYLDNMDQPWWSYKKLGNNSILYNPNTGCGSSNIYIESRATAALYTYTPYQPNQAALNNLYGSGDGCSAYGNRNFWRIYNDWFGSTLAPNFSAQPVWQQIYTDSTKQVSKGWNATMVAGESAYAEIVMKNIGNTTWTSSGAFSVTDTRLATYDQWGRTSTFCDGSWVINCTRPATLKEASVAPGQYGTFQFAIKAPLQSGNYSESFSPIVDGRTVFSSGVATLNINVVPAYFMAQPVWQQVYTDSTKSTSLGWDASLTTGQTAYAVAVMKNTGNTVWTKSGAFGNTDTRLATYGQWGRNSTFCGNNWVINCTRPAGLKENSVAPGQYGTFEFAIRAPSQPGDYSESFSPIIDGRTTFSSGAMTFKFSVAKANFSAQPAWQQIYTDSSKSTSLGWNATLTAGQNAFAEVIMKNTGNVTWTKSGRFMETDTRLATYDPWGRASVICNNSWVINCTRPAALKEASVAPGQYGTFEFGIKAPLQPGNYSESFSPVVDGRTVFDNGVMTFKVGVN